MLLNAKLRKGLTLGMVGLISNLKQNKRAKTSNTYVSFEKKIIQKYSLSIRGALGRLQSLKVPQQRSSIFT